MRLDGPTLPGVTETRVFRKDGSRGINPTLLDWKSRPKKRENDDVNSSLMGPLMATRKNIQCLTLPAKDWIFEKQLARKFSHNQFLFQGIERDPIVHGASWNSIAKSSSWPQNAIGILPEHPLAVAEFIDQLPGEQLEIPYDLVYLDWMGIWSKEKRHAVNLLFERNAFAPHSFFCMTLGTGRSTPLIESMNGYADDPARRGLISAVFCERTERALSETKTIKDKAASMFGYLTHLAASSGYRSRLARFAVYDSPPTGSAPQHVSEMSFLFEITKSKHRGLV